MALPVVTRPAHCRLPAGCRCPTAGDQGISRDWRVEEMERLKDEVRAASSAMLDQGDLQAGGLAYQPQLVSRVAVCTPL